MYYMHAVSLITAAPLKFLRLYVSLMLVSKHVSVHIQRRGSIVFFTEQHYFQRRLRSNNIAKASLALDRLKSKASLFSRTRNSSLYD